MHANMHEKCLKYARKLAEYARKYAEYANSFFYFKISIQLVNYFFIGDNRYSNII